MKKLPFASTCAAGLVSLAFIWGATGCAQVSEGSLLVFSSRVPAIALVNGQLLQGEVQLMPDRTGAATLAVPTKSLASGAALDSTRITSCVGQLRYTSSVAGSIDLRCNAGVSVELVFTMLGSTRGYAYSQAPNTPVSMTYGLSPDEARAYLQLPSGRALVVRPGSSELELR